MTRRSDLPKLSSDPRPSGVKFHTPERAVRFFDSSISLAAEKAKGPNEISVLGEIGDYGYGDTVTAKKVREALKALPRNADVTVLVNSPGGDAFEGVAIYNLLRDHPGKVTVRVLGMAASAASVVAMAGDRIEMGGAAMLMIHSAWGVVAGNKSDLKDFAAVLDAIDRSVANVYATRSGLDPKAVLKLMEGETWMTAEDAVSQGFADVALEPPPASDTKSGKARASLRMPEFSAMMSAFRSKSFAAIGAQFLPPGASGKTSQTPVRSTKMKSTSQRLAELRADRETKAARMAEIMAPIHDDSRASLSEDAQSEFDLLDSEIGRLDNQIRLCTVELRSAASVSAVSSEPSASAASASRGAPFLNLKSKDKDDKFPGQSFTRLAIAKALAHLTMQSPLAVMKARGWHQTNPTLYRLMEVKLANEVAGGGAGSGEWGSELVQADGRYTGDFIDFLHGMTVYDRLPLREVPANITIKGSDGEATGYWVGESKAIPTSATSASAVSLTPLKVGALAVVSNELLRDSSPSAEQWIRDMLGEASAKRIDMTFLSATAASAGVSPAGILNGVSAGTASGTDADAVRTDIQILMQGFITAKNVTGLQFVTTPGLALAMQLMRNALGQPEFAGVGVAGGTLEGQPLLTGDNVGNGDLILLKPSDIWKIADSGIEVGVSKDAAIEQNSVPTGATDTPTGVATAWTSMFQSESTAIKIVRSINFQKRRSTAVTYIGNAEYGGVVS